MKTRLVILGAGDLAIGLLLLLSAPIRISSPAFASAKRLAPINTWGLALAVIGVVLLSALLWGRYLRRDRLELLERTAATAGGTWTAFWAASLLNSAATDHRVSWTGAALWFFFGTVPHLFLAFGRDG